MKFILISDVHYISRKIMVDSPDKKLLLHNEATKTVLRMAGEFEDTDTVIITGDLTEYGDYHSHSELVELLRLLEAKGKKVYLLTATHDYNLGRAYTRKLGDKSIYKSEPWCEAYFDPENADFRALLKDEYKNLAEGECVPELFPACTRPQLWDMYRQFGRDQAISVHDEGKSYCLELDENTWCLMLNDDYRDPDRTGVSSDYPTDCYKWIKSMVEEAKKKGKYIFACTHHPLVPPVPAYKIGGGDMNMRSAHIGHRLADMGINLVFSGHTHFSDIGYMNSEKGNGLYNITTPGIKNYPPQFRMVEINSAENIVKTESIEITSIDGMDFGGKTFRQYLREEFIREYEGVVSKFPKPLNNIILNMKVKNVYPFCRFSAGLSRKEYNSIKDERAFDIIMELVLNMQGGDGLYTPDSPMYKFMMGLSATLDSIIDAQPFYDVKKKLLCGYSITEVIEPMLFNNFIPDQNAQFNFTESPKVRFETNEIKSYAGEILMSILCIIAILFSFLAPVAAVVILPVFIVKNKCGKKQIKPQRY